MVFIDLGDVTWVDLLYDDLSTRKHFWLNAHYTLVKLFSSQSLHETSQKAAVYLFLRVFWASFS